ncbi:DUF4440 domain-containing protein [Rahnella sp. PCH160]|uniref:nuclear transport factor 2 family protein n=1 Tax=Rahnella sp. PCH160 TaxID=3447928 RepID=UPI0039FCB2D2
MTAILDEIKALECSLHNARRNDKQWLERVLHPDFREITRSGKRVDRHQTIAALIAETQGSGIESDDFQLQILSEESVLLTYKTCVRSDSGNLRGALRSSIWTLTEGTGWQLVFHQGTPAAETQASPSTR